MDEQGNDLGRIRRHAVRLGDGRHGRLGIQHPDLLGDQVDGSLKIGSVLWRCPNARKTRRSNDGTYGILLRRKSIAFGCPNLSDCPARTRMLFRWECCSAVW